MYSRTVLALLFAVSALAPAAQPLSVSIKRPKITGISHLAVYTSDPAAADHFYRELVGAPKRTDPENPQGVRYAFSNVQFVEVLPLPAGTGINRRDHIAFNTDDAEGLRKFVSKAWKTPDKVTKGNDGSRWFSLRDPEGNEVQFVQPPRHAKSDKRAQRDKPPHHSRGHFGAQERSRRHLLSGFAGLPSILDWRHEGGQGGLGEPANPPTATIGSSTCLRQPIAAMISQPAYPPI
jgi:catechol 2,3-dioxygenase-like lactoylglutathione lyase family enzyme